MVGPGKQLQEARIARELTLDDAERDTRIARRYLDALEREDLEQLPAPPYARGFVRSYARYLSLDPDSLLHQMFGNGTPVQAAGPWSKPAAESAPAVTTRRPIAAWIVGGVVAAIFVIGIGIGVASLRDGGTASVAAPGTNGLAPGRTLPIETPEAAVGPRTIAAPTVVPTARDMPDFRDRDVSSAVALADDLGVPYVIFETYSSAIEPGRVIQQTPAPGRTIDERTSITLVISRGPAPTAEDGP